MRLIGPHAPSCWPCPRPRPQVLAVSAAKFHSVAITADGRLLTWGWGRGGRLGEEAQRRSALQGRQAWAASRSQPAGTGPTASCGCSPPSLAACPAGHPEAYVHSGEGAVISPLAVAALGRRQVAAVAAGKHHTVLCTSAGEVFSCGSNRHGQLGYAVDSQPTPRRVSSLRQRVVAVAAASKHSVAVTAGGDVYTWGCNVLGQVGAAGWPRGQAGCEHPAWGHCMWPPRRAVQPAPGRGGGSARVPCCLALPAASPAQSPAPPAAWVRHL